MEYLILQTQVLYTGIFIWFYAVCLPSQSLS